jgi:hypothetical protein
MGLSGCLEHGCPPSYGVELSEYEGIPSSSLVLTSNNLTNYLDIKNGLQELINNDSLNSLSIKMEYDYWKTVEQFFSDLTNGTDIPFYFEDHYFNIWFFTIVC